MKNFIFIEIMTEITPEQIIDTSENKPIDEVPQTKDQTQSQDNTSPPVFEIKATRVKDLTTEERLRLISDAKNGVDNPYFKVQFFKNGNSRITKSERIIKQRSPSLTTEQLLMEHVIGLETQLATLKQKHKKLKKNYKSLYQDVYVDDDDIYEAQSNNNNTTSMFKAIAVTQHQQQML